MQGGTTTCQQGRSAPLGSGNIAVRTKGDGQETPHNASEGAVDDQSWHHDSQKQQAQHFYPTKPARSQSAPGAVPMGASTSHTGREGAGEPTKQRTPAEQKGSGQVPSPGSSPSLFPVNPGNRRRVNSLAIRSLKPGQTGERTSPPYEKDSPAMPQSATYLSYSSHPSYDRVNGGTSVSEAILQKIQAPSTSSAASSTNSSRRRRSPYTPTFASRTPATDAAPTSLVSSRTSSVSDLSTSYPADNVYQGPARHYPAHPASGQQQQQQQQQQSRSQPSSGYHTPVQPGSGYLTPTNRRPGNEPSSQQQQAASPSRQRSERTHQRRHSDEHIAPANIHTVSPFSQPNNDSIYATTTALLKAASAGSRAGVVMPEKIGSDGFLAGSPTSPHKERALVRDHNLHRGSSNDSLSSGGGGGGGAVLVRGVSNDSVRSLDRLAEDRSVSDGMGLYETAISPMGRTISSGSVDSAGSSGIGSSASPSVERGVRMGNMTTINESSRHISRSSSGSSLSTSSSSLDAGGNGQKRVVFGASSDRKKIKTNKEPPTIQEAKQAAIRSLAVGQAMEAATSGNLAHLHRLHAHATQSGEQITIMRDATGATPLHRAAENGHVGVVNFLLNETGLSEEGRKKATAMADADYITPCMLAVQNGHVECVKMLVETSQGDFETDDHGSTLLHLAAAFDQVECTEYIVEAMKQHDLDPHVATDRGVTPAHVAAQKGSINCLRILFDAGTQIQPDDEDLTPIDWARKADHGLCEHYLTVIQTCWALHASLEEAETKLAKTTQQNRALEAKVAEAQKQQAAVDADIQRVKEECDRRVKETKEDFAQLMTRMMEQVGGGKAALEEKVKGMNLGALVPTGSPPTGKKSKSSSPPVPPRTVTLPGSEDATPSTGRTEKRRGKVASGDVVRSNLKLQKSTDSGHGEDVMSVVEREQQLDSLTMSNFGVSDVEDEEENEVH